MSTYLIGLICTSWAPGHLSDGVTVMGPNGNIVIMLMAL